MKSKEIALTELAALKEKAKALPKHKGKAALERSIRSTIRFMVNHVAGGIADNLPELFVQECTAHYQRSLDICSQPDPV